MSLIFRTDFSRPLTHEEVDSNFKFVYVKPWNYDDYRKNMLVWFKGSDDITRIYSCVNSHLRFVYDPSKQFTDSAVVNGTPILLWVEIANTAGGGTVTGSTGADVLYDPSLSDNLSVPNSVGGIAAGTTVAQLRNKTFTELWNRLLFPSVPPTFVAPSISMTSTITGYQIIGTVVSLTLTGTANRGSILQPWNGNSVQNSRAGAVQWYNFDVDGVNLPNGNQTASNTATNPSITITQGQHQYRTQIRFLQGPQPLDNYGLPYSTPLAATTLGVVDFFEGVYPLFATSVINTTLTQQTLYSMINGNNIELVLAAELNTTDRQAFAVPQVWLNARPLQAVYYFNTVSGSFSNVNKISEFTTTSITQTIAGQSVSYTKYTYNGLMRGEMRIKLVF